jgi:hypothetical protein
VVRPEAVSRNSTPSPSGRVDHVYGPDMITIV